MTDITELAQREKFEAWWERTQHNGNPPRFGWSHWRDGEGYKVDDDDSELDGMWEAWKAASAELLEALEKAQGMETYWKTQCRGITDHCEELQARIAELESHTVKPPVHPTVASEKLDDETLQELIEFRRTTFEYHSKEGNKVQTIIHGVTLAALRELQERRKANSEPVATLDVQSRRPDGNKFALVFSSAAHKLPDDVYFLYRHAQPATVTERDPIAWLNDAYLARGVVDGEAGSEDAGPGYIPVYREAGPQPAPVVSDDLLSMAASAIEDLLEHTDPNTSYYSGVWADVPGKLRAAMLQAGNCRENANSSTNNCREIPETSTNRSREHFISLCNEFWNWSEMDEVCAEDRGYELRMEWDGKVFKHPVTQALWRMYQATPQEVK
ncbi:hypothetical protein [Klebsiella quasipneumoniae]|uniref:Uncharacterized protein n=1 Tax=Klebsiella quasipneumoniae subsp. quasipneumoniae TaxID=1667327 RepID=A0AAW8XK33_9ENTR|nr:hypothetical protein [Klebsiella quasipneumoniae]MDV0840916.1 hypothetical protein [Klebsiella quasipneumoniae subsp. quasipneumoniae]MDZ0790576.1 hypothetical protein [Klebsiella quasipneumoniae]